VAPADNAAAYPACQIINNTNVQLKYHHTKIPYLFGKVAKDTITSIYFITRVDEFHGANNWTNVTTY
jgi:hypothetical protein